MTEMKIAQQKRARTTISKTMNVIDQHFGKIRKISDETEITNRNLCQIWPTIADMIGSDKEASLFI